MFPDMADLIKADELKNRLKKIPEWELEKKHIERTFEFDEFSEAIDFVNSVAEVAEEEEHHPDIDIRFNKVRLILSTHSKGGLTDLDFSLAERIDTRIRFDAPDPFVPATLPVTTAGTGLSVTVPSKSVSLIAHVGDRVAQAIDEGSRRQTNR